jgi:hypothetical protein
MRIHGQVYLGVKPPFSLPSAWLTPRAPVLWECALQWLALIMSHS